jgi:regulatory protein
MDDRANTQHRYANALQRVQGICARQERCISDIRQKLRQWEVDEADAERIISSLIKDGFINEQRYATFFVRDRSRLNRWGRLKIAQALRQKGIPDEAIALALEELQPQADESTLAELLTRKANSTRAKSPYDLKSKLIRFGVSRGFEFEMVVRVAEAVVKK